MARTPITAPTTPTKKTGTKAKSFTENNSRAKALHRIVAAQTAFKPASEVLLKVRAVPTPFVQVDRLTRCGGWPVERVSVIHGPSNDGKSTFLLGLGRGFLERGHIFAFIDAEHATPMDYVAKILGPYADSPNFIAMRPDSYEGTIDAVSSLCKSFETERGTGELDAMTTGLIGLDSIKKLVPKRILAALLNGAEATKGRGKQAKEVGVDGMRGMAAMYKAALNTQWMDQLVPQLARSGLGIAIIARETVEESDDFFGQEKVTLGGGAALNFDASLRVRVSVAKNIVDDEKNLIGVRHAVEVFKTKIGTREKKRPVGFFHTSTGLVTPEGLDRARDLIEIGTELDVITQKGSWFSFGGEKLGQGEDGAAFKLSQSEDWMRDIERAVRDAYAAESSVPR